MTAATCLTTMPSRATPGHVHRCHLAEHEPAAGHVCRECGRWFWCGADLAQHKGNQRGQAVSIRENESRPQGASTPAASDRHPLLGKDVGYAD